MKFNFFLPEGKLYINIVLDRFAAVSVTVGNT